MQPTLTRRDLFVATPGLALATGLIANAAKAHSPPETNKPELWPGYPKQNTKLVREVVGASHRDEARVRELVTANPALVNAWWDWGFGDWESPLGAASHVGRRGIAEFLLERGARIDIFAAAMLGMTDVVKAFVAAQPGIQRSHGPHGITLLNHARAGGPRAADTLAYLESLGDAGIALKSTPVPENRRGRYLGKYANEEFGVRFECKFNKSGQALAEIQSVHADPNVQNIHHVGDDEFYPSGVPSVKIQFAIENGQATLVTVRGHGATWTAKRVS
jgi:hypothetical protein